jgi:hypothetical protein
MTEESLKDVAKLRVRVRDLAKAEETMVAKLEACLVKWEKLCLELGESASNVGREDLLRLRAEAYEALKDALESQSKVEHERSHIPESLGSLFLDVENDFQRYLHGIATENERTSAKNE